MRALGPRYTLWMDVLRAGPPLHQGCGANCEGAHMAKRRPKVNRAEAFDPAAAGA